MTKRLLWGAALAFLMLNACNPDSDPACECYIPWVSSAQLVYEEGESVKHNGQCWLAKQNIQADLEEPGSAGSSSWEACDDSEVLACDCPNEWSVMLEYPAGSIVFYQNDCYIARLNNSKEAPGMSASVWVLCE